MEVDNSWIIFFFFDIEICQCVVTITQKLKVEETRNFENKVLIHMASGIELLVEIEAH